MRIKSLIASLVGFVAQVVNIVLWVLYDINDWLRVVIVLAISVFLNHTDYRTTFSREKKGFYTGKVCWVTGASNGVGRALAIELSKRGAVLILSGNNEAELEETRKLCRQDQTNANCAERAVGGIMDKIANVTHHVPVHMGIYLVPFPSLDGTFSLKSLTTMGEEAWKKKGTIDILFNNPGAVTLSSGSSFETDAKIATINFSIPMFLTKWFMAKHGMMTTSGHAIPGKGGGPSVRGAKAAHEKDAESTHQGKSDKLNALAVVGGDLSPVGLTTVAVQQVASSSSSNPAIGGPMGVVSSIIGAEAGKGLGEGAESEPLIVNTNSIAALLEMIGGAAFSASKAGLLQFSKTVVKELALVGNSGVGVVNCLIGPVRGEIVQSPVRPIQLEAIDAVIEKIVKRGLKSEEAAQLMLRAASNKIDEAWICPRRYIVLLMLKVYAPMAFAQIMFLQGLVTLGGRYTARLAANVAQRLSTPSEEGRM